MEITESEQQRESGPKTRLKNEQSLRNFSDFNRRSNICVIHVWEGEEKQIGLKKWWLVTPQT